MRRAESANLPVKEVQEESSDNGWQFSIMGRRVQHLKRDPTSFKGAGTHLKNEF